MEAPRKLTDKEVERVLNSIPRPPSLNKQASLLVLENMKVSCESLVRDIVIVGTEEAIEDLCKAVYRMFSASFTTDDNAIGVLAASSISSAATQGTMKTIHDKSGSSGLMQGGLRGVKALLTVQKEAPNPRMVIHFTKRVSKMDVANMRSLFIEMTIEQMVRESVIGILRDKVGEKGDNVYLERFWWHNVSDYRPSDGELLLRIYLDPDMMYEHKVLPIHIAEALYKSSGKDQKNTRDIHVIPSPMVARYGAPRVYCFVDVFKKDSRNKIGTLEYQAEVRSELYHHLRLTFPTTSVKGVPGIKEIDIVEVPVSSLFKQQRELYPRNDDLVAIDIDYVSMITHASVSLRILEDYLYDAGIEIVERIRCRTTAMFLSEKERRIEGYVIRRGLYGRISNTILREIEIISDEGESVTASIVGDQDIVTESLNKDGLKYEIDGEYIRINKARATANELLIGSSYYYAITKGINMRGMAMFPWVDVKRMVCNDPRKMTAQYGCEASLAYHSIMLMQGIASIKSKDTSSRHVSLVIDNIYNKGSPAGINIHGSRERAAGFVQRASLGASATSLVDAGIMRDSSSAKIPMTAVMVGSLLETGNPLTREKYMKDRISAMRARVNAKNISDKEAANTIDIVNSETNGGLTWSKEISSNRFRPSQDLFVEEKEQVTITPIKKEMPPEIGREVHTDMVDTTPYLHNSPKMMTPSFLDEIKDSSETRVEQTIIGMVESSYVLSYGQKSYIVPPEYSKQYTPIYSFTTNDIDDFLRLF